MTQLGTAQLPFGLPRIQYVTSPAAGADWTYAIPARSLWLIHSIRHTFACGAGSFTTAVGVACAGLFANSWQVWRAEGIPQNITRAMYFAPSGEGAANIATFDAMLCSLQFPCWALAGDTLTSVRSAPSANNTFSEISIIRSEWIEP